MLRAFRFSLRIAGMPPKMSARGKICKKSGDDFKRLDDFKRCSSCQTLIEARLTKGLAGKKDDPLDFPCGHALHASCLVEWYSGVLGPRERALVERKHTQSARKLAFVTYDALYGGMCEACARHSPSPAGTS